MEQWKIDLLKAIEIRKQYYICGRSVEFIAKDFNICRVSVYRVLNKNLSSYPLFKKRTKKKQNVLDVWMRAKKYAMSRTTPERADGFAQECALCVLEGRTINIRLHFMIYIGRGKNEIPIGNIDDFDYRGGMFHAEKDQSSGE